MWLSFYFKGTVQRDLSIGLPLKGEHEGVFQIQTVLHAVMVLLRFGADIQLLSFGNLLETFFPIAHTSISVALLFLHTVELLARELGTNLEAVFKGAVNFFL